MTNSAKKKTCLYGATTTERGCNIRKQCHEEHPCSSQMRKVNETFSSSCGLQIYAEETHPVLCVS